MRAPVFRPCCARSCCAFWKVGFQTIAAPVITALLYLLVFAHVLEGRLMVYGTVPYTAFLIPGLMMMSMLQNAFANPSSSLIQSRITGNLVFMLLPPLSHRDIFGAFVLAAVVRGLAVGLCVWAVALFFVSLVPANPLWLLVFAVLSCGIMAVLGVVAGLWSEKFDQLAAFQNFLIMPATFLSGVFYSIHTLPPFWQSVSPLEPHLLRHRRIPLRVLRGVGRLALAQPGGGDGGVPGAIAVCAAASGQRLQTQELTSMLPTPAQVRQYIADGLSCEHLDVQGDGSHFDAVIVSTAFEGKRLIQRHQLVYAALGDRMKAEIHALSMRTLTPAEYQQAGK